EQAMDRTYWVYILASGPHGTLYVGVTNSLERRVAEHKAKETRGFAAAYDVDRLVYFHGFGDLDEAIRYEKQLKRCRRPLKLRLNEEDNPTWHDLSLDMMALPPMHPDIAAALAENGEKRQQQQQSLVIPVSPLGEDRDPLSSELKDVRAGRRRR